MRLQLPFLPASMADAGDGERRALPLDLQASSQRHQPSCCSWIHEGLTTGKAPYSVKRKQKLPALVQGAIGRSKEREAPIACRSITALDLLDAYRKRLDCDLMLKNGGGVGGLC